MNPKDQIHYDIAELLEKIAHLNIKLAGTAKIHPVEIDLLRSYLTELEKLANAMPVMPIAKPSFSIPSTPQEEATTLPSFNTPLETEPVDEPVVEAKPAAEDPKVEEPVAEVETHMITEPETTEVTEEAAAEPDLQTEEALTTETDEVAQTIEEPEVDAFAFEDLAAPITDTPGPSEPSFEEPKAEDDAVEPETTETIEASEPITEETHNGFVDTPTSAEEPLAEHEPEPLPEQPNEEPQANTGPELPIVETPLSYEPPVKEPDQKRSINDMFSREGKEDLGSRFQFQNRKNLREMIDLSERYVFTKELFGGDADYYDRAIRQLNQFEAFADAQAYMDNELHNKYNWANKEQVKKQFARIVERRFA